MVHSATLERVRVTRRTPTSTVVVEQSGTAALRLFAALWAIATLFHYAAYPYALIGLSPTLVMLAAVAVLLRPSSLVRFFALLGLQAAAIAHNYPNGVSNHWLFSGVVSVTVLTAGLLLFVSRRRQFSADSLFRTFAPVVRVELLVLYFFAVLHKLNVDFLNPAISCATELYTDISTAYLLPSPPWVLASLPIVTLVVETAIPVLLCVRRTRVVGVAVGVLFHAMLALNPAHTYFDFSSMLFAMYFLFLPYDFAGTLKEHWSTTRIGNAVANAWDRGILPMALRISLFVLAGVIVANWGYQALQGQVLFQMVSLGMLRAVAIAVWSLYAGVVLVVVLRAAASDDLVGTTHSLYALSLRNPVLAVFPLLLLFNGFNPYLGLKTESSFSMFSNLKTEDGQTNHLFIPSSLQFASYQRDLVQIVESSNPTLQMIADDEHPILLPYEEFKSRVARLHGASVTYVRNGELHVVPRIGDDPELSTPQPFAVRKLLDFRPVDTYEAGFRCAH